MRKLIYAIMLVSVASAGAMGCSNFLSSNDVTKDPNNPTAANAFQLFNAIEASQWTEQEALLAITSCIMIQQCSGRGSGRFLDSYTQYTFSAQDFSADFSAQYIGGGLIDLRSAKNTLKADGNLSFLGIVQIYEALVGITAAGIWGDIPWSQAIQSGAPLEPQLNIYNDLLAELDSAITELAAPLDAANVGPTASGKVYDLVFARFGGNWQAQWTRVAHTMKARIYMHMAEVNGAAAYNSAITEALLGINNINESFRSQHSTTANEGNQWYQFNVTAFGRDLTAGNPLVSLMQNRDGTAGNLDPRLPQYFGCFPATASPPCSYRGNTFDVDGVSGSFIEGTRNDPSFNQGIVTWEENQLILAEAYVATGAAATAKPYVDAVRASYGFPALAAAPTAAQVGEEKYIAMFQNIEAWSDYKRTCFPALVPENGSFGPPAQVPGRLYYGDAEINGNGANYPTTQEEQLHGGSKASGNTINGFRNPDDPNPC